MRVLIVSDAPDACAAACRSIGGPILADRAVDGGDALQKIRDAMSEGAPFDMLCVALGLRDMDGLLLLKCVRDAERQAGVAQPIPVWMLTSTDTGRGVLQTCHERFDAHLHLPDGRVIQRREAFRSTA